MLLTKDRPTLLEKVLNRLIKYTDWEKFDLWILDNFSTPSNKKIISMYKALYPFINIYSNNYNQLALIQNEIIERLKADFYIKLDDDILVSENWTDGFVGVFERNHAQMSFGSVVMPINGFGWVPFLQIMNLTEQFKLQFPQWKLEQECMDVAIYADKYVNEFIWNNCLDMDSTVKTFIDNQEGKYVDYFCPHRYSIGSIVFGYDFWEKMGGWKVQDGYSGNLKKQKRYQGWARSIKKIAAIKDINSYSRLDLLCDILADTLQGEIGLEEIAAFNYTKEKGLKIPITTQSLVFHFSFGPVDQYLMNTVYQKIKF